MDSIEPDINEKIAGIPELLFTLGRKAGDYIGTQGDTRNLTADLFDQSAVVFNSVIASHQPENLVIACLYRQIYLLADFVQRGYGIYKFITHILGVVCQKSQVEQSVSGIQFGKKIGKVGFPGQVLSVRVHILSKKSDFPGTAFDQFFDLVNDIIDRPASFAPATVGDYAIRAEIITALCDRDICCWFSTSVQCMFPPGL